MLFLKLQYPFVQNGIVQNTLAIIFKKITDGLRNVYKSANIQRDRGRCVAEKNTGCPRRLRAAH